MSVNYSDLFNGEHRFSFDTTKYPFLECLNKIFDERKGPAETLHEYFAGSDNLAQINIQGDTSTRFHNKYYNSEHYPEMVELYQRFVKECVLPRIHCDDTEFIVQKEPSFRIHLPNNSALGFRPSMNDPEDKIGIHCDNDYGHPDPEINFMLTFGNQSGNNSCYVETGPTSDIFHPIEMKYGEFVSFYGNKCRHFNRKNDTGISRVSIDFRIMPASKYNPDYDKESLHSKRKFLIGGYYTKFSRI